MIHFNHEQGHRLIYARFRVYGNTLKPCCQLSRMTYNSEHCLNIWYCFSIFIFYNPEMRHNPKEAPGSAPTCHQRVSSPFCLVVSLANHSSNRKFIFSYCTTVVSTRLLHFCGHQCSQDLIFDFWKCTFFLRFIFQLHYLLLLLKTSTKFIG